MLEILQDLRKFSCNSESIQKFFGNTTYNDPPIEIKQSKESSKNPVTGVRALKEE